MKRSERLMKDARWEWLLAYGCGLGWVLVLVACWAVYGVLPGPAVLVAVGASVVMPVVMVAAVMAGCRYRRRWEVARAIRTKADEVFYEGRAA
jgi:hypothetical protein